MSKILSSRHCWWLVRCAWPTRDYPIGFERRVLIKLLPPYNCHPLIWWSHSQTNCWLHWPMPEKLAVGSTNDIVTVLYDIKTTQKPFAPISLTHAYTTTQSCGQAVSCFQVWHNSNIWLCWQKKKNYYCLCVIALFNIP